MPGESGSGFGEAPVASLFAATSGEGSGEAVVVLASFSRLPRPRPKAGFDTLLLNFPKAYTELGLAQGVELASAKLAGETMLIIGAPLGGVHLIEIGRSIGQHRPFIDCNRWPGTRIRLAGKTLIFFHAARRCRRGQRITADGDCCATRGVAIVGHGLVR